MRRIGCAILLLAMAGCGKDSGTVPVSGVVRLDGQPLKGAAIQFVPQGKGRDATGTADDSGKFVMSTFEPRDGAMPGSYKVVVTPATDVEATPAGANADQAMMAAAASAAAKPKANTSGVPEAYTRLDRTTLTQEVPPKGEVVIDLKSK